MVEIEKSTIDDVLSFSAEIPKNELHVQEGSECAMVLGTIKSPISLGLIANADKRFRVKDYALSFEEELNIVYRTNQKTQLVVNSCFGERAKNEFRENKVYETYSFWFINPPIGLFDFLKTRDCLAPFAMHDSVYEP